MTEQIDTTNKWFIAKSASGFIVMRPPKSLTEDEALVFAAYIVAMVGDEERWQAVFTAVSNV